MKNRQFYILLFSSLLMLFLFSSCQTINFFNINEKNKTKALSNFDDKNFIDWINNSLLKELETKSKIPPYTYSPVNFTIYPDFIVVETQYTKVSHKGGIDKYKKVKDLIYNRYKQYIEKKGGKIKIYKSMLGKYIDNQIYSFMYQDKKWRYRGRHYYKVYLGIVNHKIHSMLIGFVHFTKSSLYRGEIFAEGKFCFVSTNTTKTILDKIPNRILNDYEDTKF